MLRSDGELLLAGRGGHEHSLRDALPELVGGQGAVVKRARQAEAVVNQALLARSIAVEHARHLRQRHVAFVGNQQPVPGLLLPRREPVRQVSPFELHVEVVKQRVRSLSNHAAAEVPAVVLDAVADAALPQVANVLFRPLPKPPCNVVHALGLEATDGLLQLELDILAAFLDHVLGHKVVARWVDPDAWQVVVVRVRVIHVAGGIGDVEPALRWRLARSCVIPDGVVCSIDRHDVHAVNPRDSPPLQPKSHGNLVSVGIPFVRAPEASCLHFESPSGRRAVPSALPLRREARSARRYGPRLVRWRSCLSRNAGGFGCHRPR
eukprot:scaffold29_cov251-Pinguiococcus_pyrenoidosus.AAC.15